MKNIFLIMLILVCCSNHSDAQTMTEKKRILIVYLSRTNNTKAVAEIIHEKVGGKLVALELKKPYPENYSATVEQVKRENESGYLPPLNSSIDNIASYELVFIGFPTWDMKLPPPVKRFLKQYDLRGKTIVPFNTNGGGGVGSGFRMLSASCNGCRVLAGYTTIGGSERDGVKFVMEGEKKRRVEKEIEKWLRRIKIINQ